MSLVINNNIMAYGATNSLNGHYAKMGKSVQRLSSGLRINGAADDSAGLAVRELMRSDISTLQQGIRNANDAVSMIQTADGALGVIDEKLIRMKELAEQAATGTYDQVQRNIINDEYQQMASEITRIANATDFNQIKLLDGTLSGAHQGNTASSTGSLRVQFGTGNDSAEDYYDIQIEDSTASALGVGSEARAHSNENIQIGAVVDPTPDTDPAAGEYDDTDWTNFTDDGMRTFAVELNEILGATAADGTVTAQADITFDHLIEALTQGAIDFVAAAHEKGQANDLTVDDMNKWAQDMAKMFDVEGDDALQTAFQSITFKHSTMAGAETGGSWRAEISDEALASAYADGYVTETADKEADLNTFSALTAIDGTANITDPERVSGTEGPRSVLLNEKMNELNATMEAGNNISTQANAQRALAALDKAIVKKDSNRAELGAYQNRLEATVANLTVQRANLQASESRVSDIDVASEMTNFVRNQTLTQSAVGMLSQANSLPQMALQLIG